MINRVALILLVGLVTHVDAITPKEELALMSGKKKAWFPLLVRAGRKPGPSVLVGDKLYFTEADTLCPGKNVYVYDPAIELDRMEKKSSERALKEVLSLPCIYSLQAYNGKLLIQHRLGKGKESKVQMGFLDVDSNTLVLKTSITEHSKHQIGNVYFHANGLPKALEAQYLDAKFDFHTMNPFSKLGQTGFLLRSPKGNLILGDYPANVSTRSKDAGPRLFETPAIQPRELVSSAERFVLFSSKSNLDNQLVSQLTLLDLDKEEKALATVGLSSLSPVPYRTAELQSQFWFARDLRFLVATPGDGVLMADLTSFPGEKKRIWYLPLGEKAPAFHQVAGVGSRDLSGIGVTKDGGLLVSRPSVEQIDIYLADSTRPSEVWKKAVKVRLAREDLKLPFTQCGDIAIRKLGRSLELAYLEEVRPGEKEYVPLFVAKMEESKKDQWVCDAKSEAIALLSKEVTLSLVDQHLDLALTYRTQTNPLATNVPSLEAIIARKGEYLATKEFLALKPAETQVKSVYPLLFVLKKKKLGLVWNSLADTKLTHLGMSGHIDQATKQSFFAAFPARVSDGKPLPHYKVLVSNTGKTITAEHYGEMNEEEEEIEDQMQEMMDEM